MAEEVLEEKEDLPLDENPWKLAQFGNLDGLKKFKELKVEQFREENEGGEGMSEEDISQEILDGIDDRLCSPLCWAARNGNLDVVNWLLDENKVWDFERRFLFISQMREFTLRFLKISFLLFLG